MPILIVKPEAKVGEVTDPVDVANARSVRAAIITIDQVDPEAEMVRQAMERYYAEIDARFEHGFDPGEAGLGDPPSLRVPHGCFLAAIRDGRAVACGGVRELSEGVAEIKRMWVDPEWRGMGLGSRMLRSLEDRARQLGYRTVRLDTNSALTEAIALYERAGYGAIERYNDNPHAQRWFEKALG
jgi:GNAT superfamily N-acetyltransferase